MSDTTPMEEAISYLEQRIEKGNLRAYYYSFSKTGDHDIDLILAAVAAAGKGYHNTDGWCDDEYGPSYVDQIQEVANRAAASRAPMFDNAPTEIARLQAENAELRRFIPTSVIRCRGDKCREPWCESCNEKEEAQDYIDKLTAKHKKD